MLAAHGRKNPLFVDALGIHSPSFLSPSFTSPPYLPDMSAAPAPFSPGQSPFAIPETLENILVHLEQRTLVRSAILVSHAWLKAGHRFIVHEFVWDDSRDERELNGAMARLPSLTRFQWNSSRLALPSIQTIRLRQWNSFCHALTSMHHLHQKQESGIGHEDPKAFNLDLVTLFADFKGLHTVPPFAEFKGSPLFAQWTSESVIRLRELELSGHFATQLMFPAIFRSIASLPSLTSLPSMSYLLTLKLKFIESEDLQLSTIFQGCQQLQHLHIISSNRLILPGP